MNIAPESQLAIVGLAILGCVGLVVVTVWLTIYVGLRHFAPRESPAVQRSLHFVHGVVATLPWLALSLTAALVLRAYLKIGEWPHGGEHVPDGTSWIGSWRAANIDVGAFWPHDVFVRIAGVAVLASVLLYPPLQTAVRGRDKRRDALWSATYIVGFALFGLVMLCDIGGVAEWLDG